MGCGDGRGRGRGVVASPTLMAETCNAKCSPYDFEHDKCSVAIVCSHQLCQLCAERAPNCTYGHLQCQNFPWVIPQTPRLEGTTTYRALATAETGGGKVRRGGGRGCCLFNFDGGACGAKCSPTPYDIDHNTCSAATAFFSSTTLFLR